MAQLVAAELSSVVDAQTIGRFLEAYGLDVLRAHHAAGEADVARPL